MAGALSARGWAGPELEARDPMDRALPCGGQYGDSRTAVGVRNPGGNSEAIFERINVAVEKVVRFRQVDDVEVQVGAEWGTLIADNADLLTLCNQLT